MPQVQFRAIVAQLDIDPDNWVREVRRVVKNTGEQIRRDFKSTVRTWKRKPTFRVTAGRGMDIAFIAGTDNEIYAYVNDGTAPHFIYARRAAYLRYQVGYRAKTQPYPAAFQAQPGGSYGPIVYRKSVYHPGNEGRFFNVAIQEKNMDKFIRDINIAHENWVNKSMRNSRSEVE